MTEQEVDDLGRRLTRIWEPENFSWSPVDWVIDSELWNGIAYDAQLDGERGINLRVHVSAPAPFYDISLFLSSPADSEQCGGHCFWLGEEVEIDEQIELSTEAARCLATRHLPRFRRDCWLSGVPVGASAHEKVEWMRGFSQEEIEAWDLKMEVRK